MKPGSTVLLLTSITCAPSGIATSLPAPIALKRPASITITEFSSGGRPVPSIKVPPFTTSALLFIESSSSRLWLHTLSRLAACQKIAHAVERLQDVLGRVGVREPHIAFPKDAEVGATDNGDAGVVEQRVGERLRLPAGPLDVVELI